MKQLLLCISLFILIGCSGCQRPSEEKKGAVDTLYTEPMAMSMYMNDPERALAMIDSGVAVGNISPQRGEYLKAVTYYAGLQEQGKAEEISTKLLDDMSDDTPDSLTMLDTYCLLASMASTGQNTAKVIEYATEASKLARALDAPDATGRMAGYIAYALSQQGRVEEGIERLHRTIDDLREDNAFNSVTAWHSVCSRLVNLLTTHDLYDEAEKVCKDMLARTDHFKSHPDRFTKVPDGFDTAEFLDYATGSALALLSFVYSEQGNVSEARICVSELLRTEWSQSPDCDKMMLPVYPDIGEWQRFDEAVKRIEQIPTDTMSYNYLVRLSNFIYAAEKRGRTAEAFRLAMRANVIKDSLHNRDTQKQLAELATVYHLQEEQLARQQAEADARFFRLLAATIFVGLIAAIAFAIYFFYKRRQTAEKNKALVRMIDEMHSLTPKSLTPSPTGLTPDPSIPSEACPPVAFHNEGGVAENEVLFQRFTPLIHDEQLYRDIALDRESVCKRLGIDRFKLNQLLNSFAEGLSLPAYINNVRVDMAYKLLHDHPDRNIADIAADVGFTPQNLRLQFKKHFGITPTEYRQSKN